MVGTAEARADVAFLLKGGEQIEQDPRNQEAARNDPAGTGHEGGC